MVAQVAKRHAVPFVVLVGLHKLSPTFPQDPQLSLSDLQGPQALLEPNVLSTALAHGHGDTYVQVVNPKFDYIPHHLISLLVTDTGGHNPSYVYRLLAQYYYPEDYILEDVN